MKNRNYQNFVLKNYNLIFYFRCCFNRESEQWLRFDDSLITYAPNRKTIFGSEEVYLCVFQREKGKLGGSGVRDRLGSGVFNQHEKDVKAFGL